LYRLRILERFPQPDWSIADKWIAKELLRHGTSAPQVAAILRTGSPGFPQRHVHPEDYLSRRFGYGNPLILSDSECWPYEAVIVSKPRRSSIVTVNCAVVPPIENVAMVGTARLPPPSMVATVVALATLVSVRVQMVDSPVRSVDVAQVNSFSAGGGTLVVLTMSSVPADAEVGTESPAGEEAVTFDSSTGLVPVMATGETVADIVATTPSVKTFWFIPTIRQVLPLHDTVFPAAPAEGASATLTLVKSAELRNVHCKAETEFPETTLRLNVAVPPGAAVADDRLRLACANEQGTNITERQYIVARRCIDFLSAIPADRVRF
jgi:hypothetical protein